MTIAVAVPTGNIGRRLVPRLLAAGERVTVLTRSPDKLDPRVRERVRVEQGPLEDREFVTRATRDAQALYWLNPGNKTAQDVHAWYRRYGESAAHAVRSNGIRHVVNISTIIPEVVDAGVADGIVLVEEFLNETPAHVVHLRPGFFLENIVQQLGQLRRDGTITFSIPPSRPVAFIATDDIAAVAAQYLLDRTWTGKIVRNLHGAEDLSFEQAVGVLSEATGRSLRFAYVTPEQLEKDLVARGVSAPAATGYADIYRSMHLPREVEGVRTDGTTTPTTVAQWGRGVLRPLLGAAS